MATLEQMQKLSPEEQEALYKRLDKVRAIGKGGNYSCQYGAGPPTIARSTGVSEAVARKVHKGYWKLNWTIEKISSMMVTKKTPQGVWQQNPINKFWYSLRTEKDKFSTLIQGTGSYILDLWLYHLFKLGDATGLPIILLGSFHDEIILELEEGKEEQYKGLTNLALQKVNEQLKLNRQLGCDVQFGSCYADIH